MLGMWCRMKMECWESQTQGFVFIIELSEVWSAVLWGTLAGNGNFLANKKLQAQV